MGRPVFKNRSDTVITMPNLTPDNPARLRRDLDIASMRSSGQTLVEIGENVGISNQRVSQILNQDHIKKVLDTVYLKYVEAAPDLSVKFLALCNSDDASISLAAIKAWHKMLGLSPTPASSIFLQQINMHIQEGNANPSQGLMAWSGMESPDEDQALGEDIIEADFQTTNESLET